jgi:hypothetical protein
MFHLCINNANHDDSYHGNKHLYRNRLIKFTLITFLFSAAAIIGSLTIVLLQKIEEDRFSQEYYYLVGNIRRASRGIHEASVALMNFAGEKKKKIIYMH